MLACRFGSVGGIWLYVFDLIDEDRLFVILRNRANFRWPLFRRRLLLLERPLPDGRGSLGLEALESGEGTVVRALEMRLVADQGR